MLAPTLIVGLGGTGSRVVAKVSEKTTKEQKKRVRFVCIDTDVNDLRRLREADRSLVTIQTSAPYSVGEYLNRNTFARDNWFPTHHILNPKTPTEGAGQVRAISRLAFDNCLKEGGMAPLEKAIEELYLLTGESVDQALRVIIVSSLAGGTGSGVILPLAVYIKSFLEKRLKRNASVMRGFIMLPDIFFGGKSPEEINNLCCNGYAALRELDAFMRRSDNVQGGVMFRDMRLMLPNPSTGEYEDYKHAPFNFCFLFGAQNTADQRLGSFAEYMEQAANIVYAQSISALSGRSNSNEDNTILTLCAGHGHNRFCGAGSSRMVYPKDDIIAYMANCWALKNMGEEWLDYDRKYQEYRERHEILSMRGKTEEPMTLDRFYMSCVEDDQESILSRNIRNVCRVAGANALNTSGTWEGYIEALGAKIDEALASNTQMESALRSLDSAINEWSESKAIDDIEKEKVKIYMDLRQLSQSAAAAASAVSASLINNHILLDGDLSETEDPAHMEYWLRAKHGNMIHPNAIRYFLYGLRKTMDELIENSRGKLSRSTEEVGSLAVFLDDPDTPENESIDEYIIRTRNILSGFIDKVMRADLADAFSENKEAIKRNFDERVRYDVLKALQSHINKLIKNVELFYNTLGECLKQTGIKRAEMLGRYTNGNGRATYYVCADRVCLEAMEREMPGNANFNEISISKTIFNALKEMSLSMDEPSSKALKRMYDDNIMNYWKTEVFAKYGARLDITVVDALLQEAVYISGKKEMEREACYQYARDQLISAARLAEPFIEKPQGEIRHPIKVCCYSKNAADTHRDFLNRTLGEEGGYMDEDVDDGEIIFYHAIYGMHAVDLQQFSPEINNPTLKRGAGMYYAAYKNRVSKLGPVLSKNTDITPHLDRKWHLAKYMPDLSDEVHDCEVKQTYRAMVWGLVSGNIKYDLGSNLYVPESNDNRDFIVPNRGDNVGKENPCDKLSELVDALAINPPMVSHVLRSLDTQISNELRERKRFGESLLARRLKWYDPEKMNVETKNIVPSSFVTDEEQILRTDNHFRINEFAKDTDASIFDLLYWVKYSTPISDYDVDRLNLLRDAIIELLEYYISFFVDETALKSACAMAMIDQLKQFVKNLMADKDAYRVLDETVGMVTSALTRRFREEYQIESMELEKVIQEIDIIIRQIREEQAKNPFSV